MGSDEAAFDEGTAEQFPRRWRFPLRGAVLAACLLLAAAMAVPLVQNREPQETFAVELSAEADGTGNSPADQGPAGKIPAEAAAGDQAAKRQNPAGEPGQTDAESRQELLPDPDRVGASGTELVVHVAGAVTRPGIVRIKPGGRVADAVQAAGGAAPDADLAQVNLAALMEDGSMVVVPAVGEQTAAPVGISAPGNPPGPAGGGAGSSSLNGAAAGPVNLNTASDAELQTLPRVGPVLAARIIAWRTDHGRFARPEDLDAVPGIGETMLAALLPLVTV